MHLRTRLLPALALAAVVPLAACTSAGDPPTEVRPVTAEPRDEGEDEHDHGHAEEVASPRPRLVITYDGGVLVVDALSLDVVADLPVDGFTRLSPYGDDRHVLVSAPGGFRVLDTGTWSTEHGDHAHHHVADPVLTDVTFPAEEPGHAIPHAGTLALFDDGTGEVALLELDADLADGAPSAERLTLPEPHHGFAVPLDDGGLLVTVGDSDARTGVALLDADGTEVSRFEECPGVHGEAVLGEVALAGCEDGVVLVRDGEYTKLTSPDAFGRIGNLYVTEASTVAVGDYKQDPEGGLALHELALVDTSSATLDVVHLPEGVEYTWRGVGRGGDGEVVVLGTDGALHVLDEAGALVASHPVIDPWTAPEEWQTAHPALVVVDETAWVTDPATDQVHAVDVPTGEVFRSAPLPATPNEVTVVHP